MLTLNIMPVIQARGIERPYTFLVKAGFSRHTAHQLLKNNTHTFRLDHIEKLCRIFICEPHDLLYFVPAKDAPLPPGHPLFKLQRNEPPSNWKETLATIPYNELKEITSQLKKIVIISGDISDSYALVCVSRANMILTYYFIRERINREKDRIRCEAVLKYSFFRIGQKRRDSVKNSKVQLLVAGLLNDESH